MTHTLDQVAAALEDAQPYTYVTEDDLQRELATALAEAGIVAQREVRLSDGASRIDLLVGDVGIEVKIKGTWIEVTKQVQRYSRCSELSALVLVTTRAVHSKVRLLELGGSPLPLRLVSLVGGAL